MTSAWGKSWGYSWGVSWGLVSDAAHETVKSGVSRLWATMLQEEADAKDDKPAVLSDPAPVPAQDSAKKEVKKSKTLALRKTPTIPPEPVKPPVKLRPLFVVEQRPEPFVSEDGWGIILQAQSNVHLLRKVFEARAEKKRRQREDEDLLLLLAA